MYVTRRHSDFFKTQNRNELTESPPGPNSGFLVLHDYDQEVFGCFGGKKVIKKMSRINCHPFPQNCIIMIRGHPVMLIPVLGQPLSSNLYYVIEANNCDSEPVTNPWKAYTSWGSEDDVKSTRSKKGLLHPIMRKLGKEDDTRLAKRKKAPRNPILKPLDPENKYQQFNISKRLTKIDDGRFDAKCAAPNGQGPQFLTQHGLCIQITEKLVLLDDALGIDSKLRGRLPPFDFDAFFGVSDRVIVGKWYSPFMFINTPRKPMGMYYEVKLEQRWERFFTTDKYFDDNKGVETINVDVELDREIVFIDGKKADKSDVDGEYIWYTTNSRNTGVGLSPKLIERMKLEQAGGGWYPRKEKTMRIQRVDETPNENWMVYGCYVLVERFIIRTLGGKNVLSYEFRHTHQIRSTFI